MEGVPDFNKVVVEKNGKSTWIWPCSKVNGNYFWIRCGEGK